MGRNEAQDWVARFGNSLFLLAPKVALREVMAGRVYCLNAARESARVATCTAARGRRSMLFVRFGVEKRIGRACVVSSRWRKSLMGAAFRTKSCIEFPNLLVPQIETLQIGFVAFSQFVPD